MDDHGDIVAWEARWDTEETVPVESEDIIPGEYDVSGEEEESG